MKEIFESILDRQVRGKNTVLVTVLRKTGSSPRGKGAMMLADENGYISGTIGGGKVEYLSTQRAIQCCIEKSSATVIYGLEETGTNAIGMACGGEVLVNFQYFAPETLACKGCGIVKEMEAAAKHTTVNLSETDKIKSALEDMQSRKAGIYTIETEEYGIFEIPYEAPPRALIFGGGHIAAALAPIMLSLGFDVTVMDNRPDVADSKRFPGCKVMCIDYENIEKYVKIEANDYIMVMTNGHMGDFAVQRQVLPKESAYVGVVGSKRKVQAVNAKLKEVGLTDEMVGKVYTPIGLSIGAITPAEIAVAIAAEIINVKSAKNSECKTCVGEYL